jgi:antagonist of KipI
MSRGQAGASIIEVIKPGLLDSVQDGGRPGQAAMALSRGGAMDRDAMALANALVGNAIDEAVLELTGPGPELRFFCDAWIACVGAHHRIIRREAKDSTKASASDRGVSVPTHRPVFVAAGSVLRWQAPELGWRSWLAVAGGLSLPQVLGSRSAHLAANLGPGRMLAGDRLALVDDAESLARQRAEAVLGTAPALSRRAWPAWLIADPLPRGWPIIALPVLAGRHFGALSSQARDALLGQTWTVGPQSNRQGLRLHGQPLDTRALPQLASEPVSVGTVQLPPAGEPVILLAEHQTTGGYPRVLEVASAAAPLLAQAGAGCRVRLHLIGLEEADRLAQQQVREFTLRLRAVRQACGDPSDPVQVTHPSEQGRPQ